MGVDVFLEDAEYRVATIGGNNPATEITPGGFFSNFFDAGFRGGVGGIAASGRTAFDAINSMEAMPFDILPPSSMMSQLPYASRLYQDLYQAYSGESLDDQLKAVEEWAKLDPREVGSGGQVFGSLTRGVTIFGLGTLFGGPIGGASNLGLTEGYQTYRDLQGEGVDSSTAIEAAATVGATSFLGAFLPVSLATKSILGAVASGAAINTAFGAGARESIGFVLEQNGYPELAQQYRALDAEAIAADLILGAAFGGVSRLGLIPDAPITSEQIMDAMERLRQAENARGTAGIPKDLATAKLDAELQDRALAAVLMGKDVSIDGSEAARILDGTIIDPQKVELQRAAQRAAREELGELVEFPDDVLPTRQRGETKPADEFTGTITGVHGSARPLDSIKPAAEVDAETRYDGDGGVWGDGFYSADSGDYSWFRGSDLRMADYNAATVVESTFSKAAIFTPETAVALLKRLGVKGVDTPEQLARILRDKGYDGVIVRQFAPTDIDALMLKLQEEGVTSDTFIDQGGESMFMNQIVHFAPDKGVRITGEEATMGPLVRERRKLKEELNAKAEAKGFAHANDAYGTIYDVEQYAERRTETERQNHDYALKIAGDKYPRAKEFADETATETARLKELDRKILEMAKPRPAERVLPDEIPVTPEVDVEAAVAQSLKDFDPVVREQIDEIAMRMPDMDIKMPDGSIIKASEFKEKLNENMQAAQRDSRLFDVAVACFLRTE